MSNFAKKFAPYASVIVNGIYWNPDTPRLLTLPDAKSLLTPGTHGAEKWMPNSIGERETNVVKTLSTLICKSVLTGF